MNENFESSEEEKNVENENEFLKIKLRLEHGGEFETIGNDSHLPVNIENELLNYIIYSPQTGISINAVHGRQSTVHSRPC